MPRKRKRKIDWLPFVGALAGDRTHNPDLGPDREFNRQPLGAQDDTQATEPPGPGLAAFLNACINGMSLCLTLHINEKYRTLLLD